MITCKAQLKQYKVRALESLDKEVKLEIIITAKESILQGILKELAEIKADKLINLKIC